MDETRTPPAPATGPSWAASLGIRHPVIQAGMGGGIAGPTLAGAVSAAGGLGTVGLLPAPDFAGAIASARALAGGKPIAANLLMPYVRSAHVAVCLRLRPAVVSLFFGFDAALVRRLRDAGIHVMHQVGTADQARRALDDGAQTLILQGSDAGGHVAGDQSTAALRDAVAPLAAGVALIAAGGIHDHDTAAQAARDGFDGVAAGTRFLLTHESLAHREYKARLLAARETVVTTLFGLSWPAPHRVVANAAVRRWCRVDGVASPLIEGLNRASEWVRSLPLPQGLERALIAAQRPGRPFFTPAALIEGMDRMDADAMALYAGRCVVRIDSLVPAAEVVGDLAAGYAAGARG